MPRYWLFKSEPDAFSIDDLKNSPGGVSGWDGVRNYQVRNLLRDEIKAGDGVIFYHSSVRPPAAVGVCQVVRDGYPDRTDGSTHSDPPRWFQVDVAYHAHFPNPVTLETMRRMKALEGLPLLRRGNRLSITPIGQKEMRALLRAGGVPPSQFVE